MEFTEIKGYETENGLSLVQRAYCYIISKNDESDDFILTDVDDLIALREMIDKLLGRGYND